MTRSNRARHAITGLQQAILDYIWKNGPSTSEQIREALAERHPLKDSSIRTLLRRLESRGYLTHTQEGKVFRYAATEHQQSVAARAVKHIIDRFCAGSVEQFLLGMVDEKILTARELERLAKKAKKSRK